MENIELSISLINLDIEVSVPLNDINIIFTVGEKPTVIVDVPSDSTALFNLANELQDTGVIIDSQTYNLS